MDPFQKPSKPPFHKAWQGYSIEPGWQPSLALIYYCQTVCCLYLPRLTNWTLVGLAAPPENWSYCYLLREAFHGMCQKLDQVVAVVPSLSRLLFFFQACCCCCVVLFSSNSEQLFRLDWDEIHWPKGKIPGGRSERSPKRCASPPWFSLVFQWEVPPLSFCHIGKGSSVPLVLKVWSQEHHPYLLGIC